MTKAEARKMARLEAENAELRATLDRVSPMHMDTIREACAYRVAIREIMETITEAREFAK